MLIHTRTLSSGQEAFSTLGRLLGAYLVVDPVLWNTAMNMQMLNLLTEVEELE
jgi:hypothetical protein